MVYIIINHTTSSESYIWRGKLYRPISTLVMSTFLIISVALLILFAFLMWIYKASYWTFNVLAQPEKMLISIIFKN